jgi:hypothetical protein
MSLKSLQLLRARMIQARPPFSFWFSFTLSSASASAPALPLR